MALPSTFDDLITPLGEVKLEETENGVIYAPVEVVEVWLQLENPTGKVAEYIQKWTQEERI